MLDKDIVLFSVAGVGTPIQLRSNNFQGGRISASELPTSEVAVTAYESRGESLTVFSCFGVDPLGDNAALQALRGQRFNDVTDLQNVFGDIVNASCHSFENAILTCRYY